MSEWSENDTNNVDVFNEDDYLVAMIANNHEQEDCDDISQSMNLSYNSQYIQKYLKEKGKFSTILLHNNVQELQYVLPIMNVS